MTATEFWYSLTPLTVIGLPSVEEVTDWAVQLPGGPYCTTPLNWALVLQLTCTDDAVRSVRYGARVSRELVPGSEARAGGPAINPGVASAAAPISTAMVRRTGLMIMVTLRGLGCAFGGGAPVPGRRRAGRVGAGPPPRVGEEPDRRHQGDGEPREPEQVAYVNAGGCGAAWPAGAIVARGGRAGRRGHARAAQLAQGVQGLVAIADGRLDVGVLAELVPADQAEDVWGGPERGPVLGAQGLAAPAGDEPRAAHHAGVEARGERGDPVLAIAVDGVAHLGELAAVIGVGGRVDRGPVICVAVGDAGDPLKAGRVLSRWPGRAGPAARRR